MILVKGVEKMDNLKTGQFIKDLRTEKGLTQQELAEKLNCTNKAISRWETGNGSPDIDFLVPLAEILGVSVNELLMGEKIKNNEILQKSNEVIIDAMKKSKKQNDRFYWVVFVCSCLVQILITLCVGFKLGVDNWDTVTVISLFITAILMLVSSKKLQFITPVTSAVIYSLFSILNKEAIAFVAFYFVITAILSQVMFVIKKFIIEKVMKKYKEQGKKKQQCILTVLILILVVIVCASTAVILEYTHALWVWQDVYAAVPPTKQMLEDQKDREDGSIWVYGNPQNHYFNATIFPWDSDQSAMNKRKLTRANEEISRDYLVEYGYLYGYFEIEHEVVETNFDVYKYWLKGSPNGAKWLVTVECSENGYNITHEKY